jgi:hypothetical protein
MEQTECSETSAFNIQTPGKYPEENLPYGEKGLRTKVVQDLYKSTAPKHVAH